MARPRKFETDEARANLLQAFWRSGYESTSLSDLEAATGMGRRSLYNAFGDKHAMFLHALADFRRSVVEGNMRPLKEPGAGVAEIRAVLGGLAAVGATPLGKLGCLICNTARETIASNSEVAREVALYFQQIETAMQGALDNAQQCGELSAEADTASLAHFFLGCVVSMSVLAKAGVQPVVLANIRDEAMKALS